MPHTTSSVSAAVAIASTRRKRREGNEPTEVAVLARRACAPNLSPQVRIAGSLPGCRSSKRSPGAWPPRCRTRSTSAISCRTASSASSTPHTGSMKVAGIKFETFAERRVRGAMIDALRKDAWPRGVRRQRRELDAAREALRRELGHEPSMADLAARVGSDEKRLSRTIVRISTIEATSPLATGEHMDESSLPTALVPSEPDAPDAAYEKSETRERVRAAIQSLPWRERKVIGLYYYGEVTMKQIGAEIGVNESRVSQLHARAIRRLRDALGDMNPQKVAEMKRAVDRLHRPQAGHGQGGRCRREGAAGGCAAGAGCRSGGDAALQGEAPDARKAALKMPRRREAVAAA